MRNIARDVEQGIAIDHAVYGISFERALVHDPSLFAEAALHFRSTNLRRHSHKRQAGKE